MKILIPIDGSKYTDMCLRTAVTLCKPADTEVTLINVAHHVSDLDFELVPRDREVMRESFEKKSEELLKQSKEYLIAQGFKNVRAFMIKGSSPADEIISYAEKDKTNIIIIGARGMSDAARFLLGGESPKVVKYAPCCVFVVKDTCTEFCAA